jgi:hypothetical protein
MWKNIFLAGAPRSASIHVSTPCRYRFLINGSLVLSDTAGNREITKIDSATGIASMLHGGDNFIGADIIAMDAAHTGFAAVFSAMIDTSEHFTTSATLPEALKNVKQEFIERKPAQKAMTDETDRRRTATDTAASGKTRDAMAEYIQKYRNRGELLMAIENYKKRENQLAGEIKKERFEVARMKIEYDSLNEKNRRVKAAIDSLKARIAGMTKGKTGKGSPAAKEDIKEQKKTEPITPPPVIDKTDTTAQKKMQPDSSSVAPALKAADSADKKAVRRDRF